MKSRSFIHNIAFVFLFVLTLVFPSCSEDTGAGYTFKMNIENNPANLDPQMAVDKESIIVISNMMEGLVKISESGGIVAAAAESFDMSENGLVYTFHLRQDRSWESIADFSAPVKADDFVFAFQRIFDKETGSPYSEEYMCIKNSKEVLAGTLPADELGVKAIDDFTVEFTLEYPYFDFLSLLSKTAAMPCCHEFFEFTKGRYGMAADAVASNGAFRMNEWNYDPYWHENYIIMRRNTSYSETTYVYPYSINFFITGDSSSDAEAYSGNDTDCYISGTADEKLLAENKYSSAAVKTAGLVFNTNTKYFGNKIFREALAKSINREAYANLLPYGLSEAFGIIPGGITVQGKSYRDIVPDRTLSVYDAGAPQIWEKALRSTGNGSVDNVSITVPDSFAGKEIIYDITGRWQNDLLFSCGVEVVSESEYKSKIADGDFDIALAEVGCDDNSVYGFLEFFNNGNKMPGYAGSDLSSAVSGIKASVSVSEGAEKIRDAESLIINDYVFVPLCYEDEYLIFKENIDGIVYYPFTDTVCFGQAKYFG